MRLDNKTAIITGAAGGIGSAISLRFALEGASVYLCDLENTSGKELEKRILQSGGKAIFFPMDVTLESDWQKLMSQLIESHQKLDILINNAGINIRKPIEEMEVEEWDTMMRVNVRSVFLGIKHTLPLMRRQKSGSIINMSSICGLVGHKYTPEAYTASKGAVTLLTKSTAVRYAKDGVRVNSLHPSTVRTALVNKMLSDPERRKERLEEIPLGRLATVDDVMNAALFLACDESSFLTGVSLPVDGGLTAY
ncbi:MAG: glucose 1-dehydrogenase [Candidatus Atribacteria bacterium]|nr:glucose 1-dehydrogenase [Candidatus Atribacteria bacterium]